MTSIWFCFITANTIWLSLMVGTLLYSIIYHAPLQAFDKAVKRKHLFVWALSIAIGVIATNQTIEKELQLSISESCLFSGCLRLWQALLATYVPLAGLCIMGSYLKLVLIIFTTMSDKSLGKSNADGLKVCTRAPVALVNQRLIPPS